MFSNIIKIYKNRKKVLGMNERNLEYIRPYNLKKAKNIADDKIETKEVLTTRFDIPTPQLIGVIRDKEEFANFDWSTLPKSFVLKPIHGLEGLGIEIFYNKDKQGNWITSDKRKISLENLKRHILEIMDGKYSLHNQKDGVFFEERVKIHKNFRYYAYKGAPDIRVIVFNNIPIMAMLRLPTKESNGKGNLAQGAIGAGIDLVTGRTTTAIIGKNKIIETIPGTNLQLSGLQIPYWNKLLKIAIQAQKATGLGFAAIDFLIDRERGPLIIELNARPGLSIQLANQDGLRWRLKKAKGLHVNTINKGIRVAKDLFGGQIEEQIETISGKQVISHIEPVKVIGDNKKIISLALIDTTRRSTHIYYKLAQQIGLIDKELSSEDIQDRIINIELDIAGEKINTDCQLTAKPIKGYKVVVGRKDLRKFLIDIKKISTGKERDLKNLLTTKINSNFTEFHEIDNTLEELSKKARIVNRLRPTNLLKEKNKFFKNKHFDYNPQFTYTLINLDSDYIIEKLNKLHPDPNTKLGQIFIDKIIEIRNKTLLFESIGNDEKFPQRSINLFGIPDEETYQKALDIIKSTERNKTPKKERVLKKSEIEQIIKDHLKKLNLESVRIVFTSTRGKKASVIKTGDRIFINPKYKFTKTQLLGTLAHEVDVHLVRAYYGSKKKYKIFQYGTAGYIEIEEGLAIYNKARVLKSQQPIRNAAIMYVSSYKAYQDSFVNTVKFLMDLGIGPKNAFKYTLRTKRGLSDTSKAGAFLKDMLYFKGYLKVKDLTGKERKALLKAGKTDIILKENSNKN